MWAGTREECLSRGCRIITKAIQIAEAHPEFRFLLEDNVFVANYVDSHRGSKELESLHRLIQEGRIEISPKWAGIYQNLPRGEALVRNLMYGKRFARDTFQVNPRVAHLGDIPGFTVQLPQILAKADIPFMLMTRMGPTDKSLFYYRAPDGSRALVWNTIKGYGWGVGLGLHHANLDQNQISNILRGVREVAATTTGPVYLGWGTDLFAPSENLPDNLKLLDQRLAPMRFHFATPAEFFAVVSNSNDLAAFSGEIPSGWGNILTSLSHLWPPTSVATDTLLSAEKFAAINFALGYAEYPEKEFETLWKCAIEAMDHNNFGQGGDIGDARKLEYARTAAMHGGEILRRSLRNIAERVKSPFPRSSPIVVFNPLSWPRDDVVRAHVSVYGDVSPGDIGDYRKATRLVDETGASVPFHIEQSYGTVSRASEIVLMARGVPSLGYKTYFMVPADKADAFTNACEVKLEDPDGKSPQRTLGADQIENEFYRISVDRATGQVTIDDKELNRSVIKDAEVVGTEERGGNSISIEPVTGRRIIVTVNAVKLEENNPARAVLRVEGELGGEPIVQRLFLYAGLKRVDLETTLDWRQGRLMRIEQVFPYEHAAAKIRYGVPFGSASGDDLFPGSGPRGGDEIPRAEWERTRQIQDWIFAGTSEWGVTITSDGLLVRLEEGTIRTGMLRGTYSTTGFTREGKPALVQVPPAGKYVFHYSVSSGKGDWTVAKSYRPGLASSSPLIPVIAVDELSTKTLPPTGSFCSFAADNLVVTALKKAEDDKAVIIRAVEMQGSSAETRMDFLGEQRSFRIVNLLEEESRGTDENFSQVRPYAITSLKLKVN
jgi:alpha-mannosidase